MDDVIFLPPFGQWSNGPPVRHNLDLSFGLWSNGPPVKRNFGQFCVVTLDPSKLRLLS